MELSKHLQDPKSYYQSICGAGYLWPSSIPLTKDLNKVTCMRCKKLIERNKND